MPRVSPEEQEFLATLDKAVEMRNRHVPRYRHGRRTMLDIEMRVIDALRKAPRQALNLFEPIRDANDLYRSLEKLIDCRIASQ